MSTAVWRRRWVLVPAMLGLALLMAAESGPCQPTAGDVAVILMADEDFRANLQGREGPKGDPGTPAPANAGWLVGEIKTWPGDLSLNLQLAGWRVCNGDELSATDYPELYSVIGTKWGSPGGTQFNLPDLRGKFLRGMDGTAGFDPDASTRTPSKAGGSGIGNAVGSLELEATKFPAAAKAGSSGEHSHDFGSNLGGGAKTLQGVIATQWGGCSWWNPDQNGGIRAGGAHEHNLVGGDNETRPVNVYVNWIIYTGRAP